MGARRVAGHDGRGLRGAGPLRSLAATPLSLERLTAIRHRHHDARITIHNTVTQEGSLSAV
jgi:hypothetical protein